MEKPNEENEFHNPVQDFSIHQKECVRLWVSKEKKNSFWTFFQLFNWTLKRSFWKSIIIMCIKLETCGDHAELQSEI